MIMKNAPHNSIVSIHLGLAANTTQRNVNPSCWSNGALCSMSHVIWGCDPQGKHASNHRYSPLQNCSDVIRHLVDRSKSNLRSTAFHTHRTDKETKADGKLNSVFRFGSALFMGFLALGTLNLSLFG